MNDLANTKKRIQELIELRDRTGLKPLSREDRVQLLNEIYDGLLYLWKQTVIAGVAKGTGAICLQLERARIEMDTWSGNHSRQPTGKFEIMFKNPPRALVVSNSENNEPET